jgi:hypothetical protein
MNYRRLKGFKEPEKKCRAKVNEFIFSDGQRRWNFSVGYEQVCHSSSVDILSSVVYLWKRQAYKFESINFL